jgi:hypothetical protein
MTLYSCRVGYSWTLVRADTPDAARRQLGERLGYEHKPWLWRGIEVRRATKRDVEKYGSVADASRRAPKTTKQRREPTARKLLLLEGHKLADDDGGPEAA